MTKFAASSSMPEPDLIELFVRPLNDLGIRYLVSGSVAAMLYGEPRVTHDIDLVVFLRPNDIGRLPTVFPPPEFYVPPPEVIGVETSREPFHFLAIVLLFLLCSIASISAAEPKTLSLHQLPPTVQKTINAELADSKLVQIEQDEEDGETVYTITRKVKNEDRYFTVSADGTLSSVEVFLDETPPPVQNTIKGQVRDGTLDNIEKTFEGNDINFEVDMTTKSGAERSFTVALDGKLTSVQVTLEETPAPVRKTINEHIGNGKLVDIFRLTEGNETSYDAEVDHGGKLRDVIVSPAGKLESIQVFLAEIPAEVQKTIKEKTGSGKITRIDQSFTPRRNVLPFEVEALKDGKPFNFSVGPKGRFLGMDE